MKKFFIILCAAIALAGCKKDNDEPVKKDTQRTVVVYISGDNNLSGAAASDINEMKEGAAGIPSDGRLVAFVDLNGSKPFIAEIKNDKRQPVEPRFVQRGIGARGGIMPCQGIRLGIVGTRFRMACRA